MLHDHKPYAVRRLKRILALYSNLLAKPIIASDFDHIV